MEVEVVRLIQKECADALLDAGISVPLKEWRLPWAKKPVRFRVTMKRPRMRGLLLMTREYLKMGVEVSDPERLGPGSGSCLCRGTHGIGKPPAGLYGVPGLSVPAISLSVQRHGVSVTSWNGAT